jgi:formamidopyrimidine-DNA glycosylase
MPELPEVETIRRGLAGVLPGKVLERVVVKVPKLVKGDLVGLCDCVIDRVDRRGKLLLLHFLPNFVLAIHLKMTGQLLYVGTSGEQVMGGHPSADYLQLPGRFTHIELHFTDGSTLYFNDMRKFGSFQVLQLDELPHLPFLKTLAPEPHDAAFTVAYLQQALQRRAKTSLKSALLDQTVIGGLGNIYADESCIRAHILPTRLSGSLHEHEMSALHAAIIQTIDLALANGGSSARDYVNAIGDKGTYLSVALAYHRTGQPCLQCGEGVIEKVVIGGRSTHFCKVCQK